jgi:hypothetical protein
VVGDRVGDKIDVLWRSGMRKLTSLASIFQLTEYERGSIVIDQQGPPLITSRSPQPVGQLHRARCLLIGIEKRMIQHQSRRQNIPPMTPKREMCRRIANSGL